MNNSVVSKLVRTIKEYGFILNRDFNELINVLPHKREVFINSGVKIFLKKVMEEMNLFNISIQHYIDTKPTEAMLGIVISIHMYRDNYISEFIVFDPIKGNVFFTDKDGIFFNDRLLSNPMKSTNELELISTNSLFLHNLYLCQLLNGCFQEIIIHSIHKERNKYALEILKRIPQISIIEDGENLRIFHEDNRKNKNLS